MLTKVVVTQCDKYTNYKQISSIFDSEVNDKIDTFAKNMGLIEYEDIFRIVNYKGKDQPRDPFKDYLILKFLSSCLRSLTTFWEQHVVFRVHNQKDKECCSPFLMTSVKINPNAFIEQCKKEFGSKKLVIEGFYKDGRIIKVEQLNSLETITTKCQGVNQNQVNQHQAIKNQVSQTNQNRVSQNQVSSEIYKIQLYVSDNEPNFAQQVPKARSNTRNATLSSSSMLLEEAKEDASNTNDHFLSDSTESDCLTTKNILKEKISKTKKNMQKSRTKESPAPTKKIKILEPGMRDIECREFGSEATLMKLIIKDLAQNLEHFRNLIEPSLIKDFIFRKPSGDIIRGEREIKLADILVEDNNETYFYITQ